MSTEATKPIDDGGPAYPGFSETPGYGQAKRNQLGEWENYTPGMSLRDSYAMAALTGLLANPRLVDGERIPSQLEILNQLTNDALVYADRMIEARKPKP